jgi:hypothetical protein
VTAGLIAIALTIPVSHAGDHSSTRQRGAPQRGPNSVWRLVQQPTSLGIGPCAQSIIDARAAGLKPLWIPYHGWKDKQIGKVGFTPSPWSSVAGTTMVTNGQSSSMISDDLLPQTGHCHDCLSQSQVMNGMTHHRVVTGSTLNVSAPQSKKRRTQTTTKPHSVTLGTDGTAIEDGLTTEVPSVDPILYSNTIPGIAFENSVLTDYPMTLGESIGDSVPSTAIGINDLTLTYPRPGTAQLMFDCPAEMSLVLYEGRPQIAARREITSAGTRRLIDCSGLDDAGTFGYTLDGILPDERLQIEFLPTFAPFPQKPMVFELDPRRNGRVWIGVRSGDRIHLRFASAPVKIKKGANSESLYPIVRPQFRNAAAMGGNAVPITSATSSVPTAASAQTDSQDQEIQVGGGVSLPRPPDLLSEFPPSTNPDTISTRQRRPVPTTDSHPDPAVRAENDPVDLKTRSSDTPESAPASSESASETPKPAPAPDEPKPAPAESAPAPNKPEPAPVESAPAPDKQKPTPAEPAAAPDKPKPSPDESVSASFKPKAALATPVPAPSVLTLIPNNPDEIFGEQPSTGTAGQTAFKYKLDNFPGRDATSVYTHTLYAQASYQLDNAHINGFVNELTFFKSPVSVTTKRSTPDVITIQPVAPFTDSPKPADAQLFARIAYFTNDQQWRKAIDFVLISSVSFTTDASGKPKFDIVTDPKDGRSLAFHLNANLKEIAQASIENPLQKIWIKLYLKRDDRWQAIEDDIAVILVP